LKWIPFTKENFFIATEDLALTENKITEGVYLSY